MRRLRTLGIGIGIGAYLGWRSARAGTLGSLVPTRDGARSAGSALPADRVRAAVEAGRARAVRVIGQALGGRTGRAA